MTKTLYVKNNGLWAWAKAYAADNGLSLSALIEELLSERRNTEFLITTEKDASEPEYCTTCGHPVGISGCGCDKER